MLKLFKLRNSIFAYSTQTIKFSARGKKRPIINLTLSERLHGFQFQQLRHYQDYNFDLYKFQHIDSGMKYYHFDCDHIDNTFSIIIKNKIENNKGANFVLQKMLQCGSKKYRVKDVIEQMKNRSFNSVNNIEVNDDYFNFPFETKSSKDFYNLLDVYFNMVFRPELTQYDFLETRGRYIFRNYKITDELEFIGKAFEESLAFEQLLENNLDFTINNKLYSKKYTTTGKSLQMLDLTFEQVKQCHRKLFNLKNSMLYSYGDLSPITHIQKISNTIQQLNLNQKQKLISVNFDKPTEFVDLPTIAHVSHIEQGSFFMLSYKIEAPLQDRIRLNILSYLMFDLPDSHFMKWLGINRPYPKLHGFRQNVFNIGFSNQENISESDIVKFEKEIKKELQEIIRLGFSQSLIEMCINHLQSNFYTNDGQKILKSIIKNLIEEEEVDSIFETTKFLRKLELDLKKQRVFQNLIKKYLVDNTKYVRLYGKNKINMTEQLIQQHKNKLYQIKKTLTQSQKMKIIHFQVNQSIQNIDILPIINVADYELFQQIYQQKRFLQGVQTIFVDHHKHPEVTFKFDISDLPEDHFNVLQLYCKVLPYVGYKGVNQNTYQIYTDRYISNINMHFDTAPQGTKGLKLYLYITIQFLEKNLEYGFVVLNGLLSKPSLDNLSVISQILSDQSSGVYNKITQQLVDFGISHVSSQFNPFLKIEDKLFNARSIAGIMIQILKVTNPKPILTQVSQKLQNIHKKLCFKQRVSILVKCKKQLNVIVQKYMKLVLNNFKTDTLLPCISTQNFQKNFLKIYFPNFKQSYIFQSFPVPYQTQQTPSITLLASTINQYIKDLGLQGGCVTYKGSLTVFLRGNIQKYLQLQKIYHNWHDLDAGKRRLFQNYSKFTVDEQFKYNISAQKVRYFKQAIIASTSDNVRTVLNKYISNAIKEQKTSMLMMGPHLDSYERLLKTGWTIQRILQQTSLSMESENIQGRLTFKPQKYLQIC